MPFIEKISQNFRQGNICALNWIFYFLLFLILCLYKSLSSEEFLSTLIFWSGAGILALAILTPPVYTYFSSNRISSNNLVSYLLLSILFGFLYLIISDILILLLE